jgi:type II secretory pathway component HofQ
LPDNLRRRLDVVDFATPVQTISTFQQGENVRMVIEPRGAALRHRGRAARQLPHPSWDPCLCLLTLLRRSG